MITEADKMLEGFLCQDCGELVDGDNPGYPRSCDDCRDMSHWCHSIKKSN